MGPDQSWEGRRHFFGAAAEAMRPILIDRARRKGTAKHGGQFQRVGLSDQSLQQQSTDAEMLVVNDLFDRLSQHHPEEAEVAKLHYFAGFSIRECGKAIGIPSSTAHDRWRFARTWFIAEMQDRNK